MTINLTETRNHTVKCDYGVKDYYKFYKNEMGGVVDAKQYNTIFRELVVEMCNIVIENNYRYKLPGRLGFITTRKYKNKVKYIEGNLINTYPPDWGSTLKMWKEFPELHEKKQIVRCENKHTNGHTYRILYIKSNADYKNKKIYKMRFNREFKRAFNKYIKANGDIGRDLK